MEKSHYLVIAALAGSAAVALAGTKSLIRPEEPSSSIPVQRGGGAGPQDRETVVFDRSIDASGTKKVTLRVPIGAVQLTTRRGSTLRVHAERSCRRPVSPDGTRWLRDSVLKVERSGNEVLIEDVPFGQKKGQNLRQDVDPKLELEIVVPDGIDVALDVSAGAVESVGRFGSLTANVSAGTLSLQNLVCLGALNLHSGAGEVNVSLASPLRRDSKISSGAGEVELRLPIGTNADVTAKVGVGEIGGLPESRKKGEDLGLGDQRRARIGRGGIRIDLSVGVGEIRIDSIGSKPSALAGGPEVIASAQPRNGGRTEEPPPFSSREFDREIREAVRLAEAEAKRELEVAHRELDLAMKEVDREFARDRGGSGEPFRKREGLKKAIRETVRAALETARIATDTALESAVAKERARKGG